MNLQEMASQGAPEAAQQPTGGGNVKPASEQQQAQFDMLLGRCRQLLAESGEGFVAALKADPVRAAVKLGTQTLRELAMMSEKSGQPVDAAVLFHVGVTLVKDIAGLANDAGIVPDEQLESFLQQVMQESIAEYMRMDADDGLLEQAKEKAVPGDPATPDDTAEHEGAETPALEQQEVAAEPAETGEEGMTEEDEMALQLANIRAKKGGAA